ncbi:MAG: NRDE family protein [Sphingorhabdus sp.]
MCVVAIALELHPKWQLVVAGNRDEFHGRASAPLASWDDFGSVLAGRDLVSGGSWLGVSKEGRFGVVTNIRDADGPDPGKASRGALIADWLAVGKVPSELDTYNPFNLILAQRKSVQLISNKSVVPAVQLSRGVHGLSNAIAQEHWPRKDLLVEQMAAWIAKSDAQPSALLDLLADDISPNGDTPPIFIRNPVYGTRCSTVVAVNWQGRGVIIERRFDPNGLAAGENALHFDWGD